MYDDTAEVLRLQSQILEGMKQVEFRLRRELQGEEGDQVFLSGSDEVPEGYRELVEEYYRSLARGRDGN